MIDEVIRLVEAQMAADEKSELAGNQLAQGGEHGSTAKWQASPGKGVGSAGNGELLDHVKVLDHLQGESAGVAQ